MGNDADLNIPHLQATFNVRLDGRLSCSSSGAWVLSPSSVGRRYPFVMLEDVAGAAFLFSAARVHFPEILVVENGGPSPVEPGDALSTTVVPETVVVAV